eukprot:TRINITY_DN106597_c0_g1_i1.p1 TRINITY_DN106597_c0_g1~~TRINITY_DN106597_c0_g1_i1.p1  ORF type:complete len:245 (+),score=43.93 TRINITY_DN106597_c0_g1_i1:85-819(+)
MGHPGTTTLGVLDGRVQTKDGDATSKLLEDDLRSDGDCSVSTEADLRSDGACSVSTTASTASDVMPSSRLHAHSSKLLSALCLEVPKETCLFPTPACSAVGSAKDSSKRDPPHHICERVQTNQLLRVNIESSLEESRTQGLRQALFDVSSSPGFPLNAFFSLIDKMEGDVSLEDTVWSLGRLGGDWKDDLIEGVDGFVVWPSEEKQANVCLDSTVCKQFESAKYQLALPQEGQVSRQRRTRVSL